MIFEVQARDMLTASILVLFMGMFINDRVRVLKDNYIPPAVTGGLLFSIASALLYLGAGVELKFDMQLRDLLLLVFFSTVGLSASMRVLKSGGRALAVLVGLSFVFLLVQDATGVGLALLTGAHPGYGMMGGSVSFAGGHGTAIAWGAEAEAAGLSGASEIGIMFATFGLICGGVIGGPIARFLMKRYRIVGREKKPADAGQDPAEKNAKDNQLYNVLRTVMILAICVSLGDVVNRLVSARGVLLPGFLTSMAVGVAITNLVEVAKRPLSRAVVSGFGEVSLNVFLSMSMMSMKLWVLGSGANLVILILIGQVLVMTLFATYIVFRVMGRDYDAVVMASGFTGLGLGATPVAIANMDAVTNRFGPSPKAFLVIPLIGAFFIDLMNATVIKLFLSLLKGWGG